MLPTLHLHLLGDFLLVSDGAPVMSINSPRLQSLLAYLILHRTAPQDRSHIAFLLWPDSTEERAHASLRKLLYQLRQALPEVEHFLHIDRQSLYWQPDTDVSWSLDIQDIEQALTQAEQAEQRQDTAARRQALERATHLYRGDLLPSCYDEWIVPERDRLRQVFLRASEQLIALLEEEHDYDAAIKVARRLLRHDPLQEAMYRQLMRLYALQGDRVAALRVYHTCVTVLERELATEPGEATRQAYESLLQMDTATPARSISPTPRGTGAPLVGRKAEWRRLQEAWRKAGSGRAHIVILSGEAGIGKTRLAEEIEAWVSRQGMATASARCYAALGSLAYAPVTAWLRNDALRTGLATLDPAWLTEIARLAPEMLTTQPRLPQPVAMTEGWQRQRFFEALARAVLAAPQPLLLLLDDLHWCDHETLEWLQYLLSYEPQARVLLIGTVRAEEALPGQPLVTFLSALQRDGLVTEIALGPLTTTETASLAEHTLGRQLDPAACNALYRETEGNALFVVEMARASTLAQQQAEQHGLGRPLPLLTHTASTLPPTVQTVLAARLAQLSPQARDVANVAAVIGREFAFSVLARASGESEEHVVRGLDELWQRRILREAAAETYDFSHDKLRELAYTSLSPAYRRLLHRRIAEAFEDVYARDLDAVSGQLAAHFERAGLSEQAIRYYQRAGKVAMAIYANTEALSAFERAAALLEAHQTEHASGDQPWETAVQVYESQGDIFVMAGHLQEARQAYQRSRSALPPQESVWQARLQRKTAGTWNQASANPHDTLPANAQQAFQEAERILARAEDQASPAWQQEWIELQFAQIWPLRGSEDDMAATIARVRPIVEQHGTQEQRELLYYALAMRELIRARYIIPEQRIALLRQTVATVQQTGNKSKLGILHLTFGTTLLWSGYLDEAEEQLGKALQVAEQLDLAWLHMRCLTFLPFISRKRGQVEQVRNLITRTLAKSEGRKNGILMGHRAWLAWREGNLVEAKAYSRAALEESQAQQDSDIFRWVGIWPLLGMALAQERFVEAMDYARMLLEPTQQLPPEALRGLLEAALHAWDTERQEEARVLLQRAMPLAEQMGYL
ncbi:MAG: AAA family ATPase [Chloroflexota bacterium]|nr:AAA family ATPase [Chloroflexota bacterium]